MSDTDFKTSWKVTTEPPYTITDPSGVVLLKVNGIESLMTHVVFILMDNSTRIAHLTAERDRLEAKLTEAKRLAQKVKNRYDELAEVKPVKFPIALDLVDFLLKDSPAHPPEAPAWMLQKVNDELASRQELKGTTPAKPPEAPATLKGCPLDTDGDGNCYMHPKGCPQPAPAKSPEGEAERRFEEWCKANPHWQQNAKKAWLAATADHAERVAKVMEKLEKVYGNTSFSYEYRGGIIHAIYLIDAAFPATAASGLPPKTEEV